jgi:hypothetical protein
MEFMGKHNLGLNINIGWIENSGDTYTWVNNIFNRNIVWFHPSIINNILWWKPNICIREFIHPYVIVNFVVNRKACALMFSQFVVYVLLLSDVCVCFSINWFVFHACYMPHSIWNGHLWKYVHYQIKWLFFILILWVFMFTIIHKTNYM